MSTTTFADAAWDAALPVLMDYIAIPARSPMFDPQWHETGHIHRAATLLRDWAVAQGIDGATVELVEAPGLTPVLLVEIPANDAALAGRTVLLYGHMDKQPEFEG